jgi:hypothetical protein
MIRSGSRQRVKYILNPGQADFRVGVSSFGACKVPSRSWVGGPGASMCGGWPDNQWGEASPVGRDTFDGRD